MGPSWCIAIWDPCSLAQIPGSNNCWSRPHQVSEADPRPPHHHCMFRVHPAKYLVPSETQNSWLMELCSQNMPKKMFCQRIGLREHLQESPIFHGKIDGVSCRFYLLNQSIAFDPYDARLKMANGPLQWINFSREKADPSSFFRGYPSLRPKNMYTSFYLYIYIYRDIYIYRCIDIDIDREVLRKFAFLQENSHRPGGVLIPKLQGFIDACRSAWQFGERLGKASGSKQQTCCRANHLWEYHGDRSRDFNTYIYIYIYTHART